MMAENAEDNAFSSPGTMPTVRDCTPPVPSIGVLPQSVFEFYIVFQKDEIGGQRMSKDSKILETEELPQTGLLRIKQVLRFVPVSRSNWWAGVKSGIYPKPLKLSERVTCWKAADIRTLVEGK